MVHMKNVFPLKKFQRTQEDFTCEQCGVFVQGNGYTNHCPACLWSKHIDVNPGDRRALCKGRMEPIAIEIKKGTHMIIHTCVNCGHTKKNKTSKNDSFDAVVGLVVRSAK
jgi:rubrerythrin